MWQLISEPRLVVIGEGGATDACKGRRWQQEDRWGTQGVRGQDFFIFNLIGRPRLNKGVEITSCPGLGQPAPPSSDAGDDHGGEGGAPWPPTELGLE